MKSSVLRRRGFGSAIAVMMISLGSLSLALVTYGAAIEYADGVYKEEQRIQKELDRLSCEESVRIIRSKNIFSNVQCI